MEQKSVSRAAHTAASLRSQLNQIAAASQMLENSTAGERSRSYLAVINQGVCRMLRTVGRLELDERLSLEEPKLSPVHLDAAPWLEDLGRRLDSILCAAGVRFSFTCPSALLIYTDTELLQQLLLEAITHLALTAGEIRLTVNKQGQNICFNVSDSGPDRTEGRPVLPELLESSEEASSLDYARRIAELLGGALMVSPSADLKLSLAISVPAGDAPSSAQLEDARISWSNGGFDPALVALSELLPAAAFLPENLG